MTLNIATLAGPISDAIRAFVDGMLDEAEVGDRLARYLRSGSVRPEWCFLAREGSGRVSARHWWWGPPGSDRPAGVDLVSVEDRDVAIKLLEHARDELGPTEAVCELIAPIQRQDARAVDDHDGWADVLIGSGFSLEVSRVRVEWTVGHGLPPVGDRLRFRPARSLDDAELLRLFELVADGSLDHWMAADRAEHGREHEARERLIAARRFRQEPDWLTVGCAPDGTVVGYAVPAVVDEVAVVGEIGVIPDYRGNGYGLELLRHATRSLADAGAVRIVADTDRDNAPMRAAFAQAGYVERENRQNYAWRSAPGS